MASASIFFDPDLHPSDTIKQFVAFAKRFELRYKAQFPYPPKAVMDSVMARWKIANENNEPTLDQYDKESLSVTQRDMVIKCLGMYSSERLYDDWLVAEPDASKREKATWEEFKIAIQAFYKPTENLTLKNFQFRALCQESKETFVSFVNRVEKDAKQCNFKCESDQCTAETIAIRDQVVIGTISGRIREEALKNSWSLVDLRKEGMLIESASRGAAELSGENPMNKIGKYSRKNKTRQNQSNNSPISCYSCGYELPKSVHISEHRRQCKARTATCGSCKRVGHYEKVCKSKSVNEMGETANESGDKVPHTKPMIPDDSLGSIPATYPIDLFRVELNTSVELNDVWKHSLDPGSDFKVQVVINNRMDTILADTGAKVSVCGTKEAEKYGLLGQMYPSHHKIKPYKSEPISVKGVARCAVTFGSTSIPVEWYIIEGTCQPVLSGSAAVQLGVLSFNSKPQVLHPVSMINTTNPTVGHNEIQEILASYPNNFSGLGKLKDYKVSLHIDKSVKPKVDPPRAMPYHIRDRVSKIISEMCENDVIEPHPTKEPAPWVSNAVIEPKNDGSLRVTLDARNINKAIETSNLPIPRSEDIKAKLGKAKIFSKMDLKSAYWQIELDEESRYMTVFRINDKLYRYKRLIMGVAPAQGELNTALAPLFAHIKDVYLIHDDLIIGSENIEDHNNALRQVMEAIHNSGLTLNPDKCEFGASALKFWGLIISADGISPDPEKVEALKYLTPPCNREDLISFLCMMQSNAEFTPNFSKISAPLREMTKGNSKFKWNPEHQQCFDKIVNEFKENTLLQYFDMNKKTFIFLDAHNTGLGAMLAQGSSIQDAKPVLIASRTTSDAERRYPQIDLEAMAIDFAQRRFRQYLVGSPNPAIVVSDHKPLISIFNGKKRGSVRSERIKLAHQDVNYELRFQRGKINQADYLSRHAKPMALLPKGQQEEASALNNLLYTLHITPIVDHIGISNMATHTKNDPTLSKLVALIRKGITAINKDMQLSEEVLKFKSIFSELTVTGNDLLLKGERIVLPASLQLIATELAHKGAHPGQCGLVRRLRSHFYFHGMDKMTKQFVENCRECSLFTSKKTKEPITPHTIPENCWQKVSVDLFGPMPTGRHVVVVQDLKSRYPSAKLVASTAADKVLPAIGEIYETYGFPDIQISDNGPPFNSGHMKKFAEKHDMELQLNTPYHPSSNPVETFMRSLGKSMKIGKEIGRSETDSLKECIEGYRQTPHIQTKIAPAAMLFRDGMKSKFPRTRVSSQKIEAAVLTDLQAKNTNRNQVNSSKYRKRSTIQPGDTVLVRNVKRVSKFDPCFLRDHFVVIHVDKTSKSVIVKSQHQTFIRHLDDIKKCPDQREDDTDGDTDNHTGLSYDDLGMGIEQEGSDEAESLAWGDETQANYPHSSSEAEENNESQTGGEEATGLRRSGRARFPNPRFQDFVQKIDKISGARVKEDIK